ncbi:SMI1/KNR4 family protein [Ornithinimicrobium sp. W1679]|uniref:SMI1/KNR4 family protein n=1 Tax=Ornithinimicrobium sp. W1679 TaxID=3418770 RepID=UPI003CF324B5
MVPSLARIEDALTRLGRDTLLRALRPGLSWDEVDGRLRGAGLPRHPQVRQLYAWHDGVGGEGGTIGDLALFPGFYPLSLDDAILSYEAFRPDPRWRVGWLPLFADGGGDFYVVDLGAGADGVVRRFRIEESQHPAEFRDLADMVDTLAAALERGIVFVDGDGHLEMDDHTFAALARQLNPTIPWWAGP